MKLHNFAYLFYQNQFKMLILASISKYLLMLCNTVLYSCLFLSLYCQQQFISNLNYNLYEEKIMYMKQQRQQLFRTHKIVQQKQKINSELYLVGNSQNIDSLIALKNQEGVTCIQNPLMIIYACLPKDFFNYDQYINLYKRNNMNVPPIFIKQVQEIEKFVHDTNAIKTVFEIWFSTDDVYKQLNLMKFIGKKVILIYFNKQKQKNKTFKHFKNVSYETDEFPDLIKSYFYRTAVNNFVIIGDQTQKARLQKMTLESILNSSVQTVCDVQRFIDLVIKKWGNIICKHDLVSFMDDFSKYNILSLYSRQTFFYKFLNHFMKITTQPNQIYYLHKIIKFMYNQINYLYQQQRLKQKWTQKHFYRGCLFPEQQIQNFKKNKGKVTLNLGFMSCSQKKKIALSFTKNALIQVIVYNQQRQNDRGYADISQYSDKNEFQYIFNPLCDFVIDSVIKENQIYEIKLIYGKMSAAVIKNIRNVKVSRQQKQLYALNKYMAQQRIMNQRQLYQRIESVKNIIQYYYNVIKYIKPVIHSHPKTIKVLKRLIQCLIQSRMFKKAQAQLAQLKLREQHEYSLKIRSMLQKQLYRDNSKYQQLLQKCVNKFQHISNLPQQFVCPILRYQKQKQTQTQTQTEKHAEQQNQVSDRNKFKVQANFQYSLNSSSKYTQVYSLKSIHIGQNQYSLHDTDFIKKILTHITRFETHKYTKIQYLIKQTLSLLNKLDVKSVCSYILSSLLLTLIPYYGNAKQNQQYKLRKQEIQSVLEYNMSLFTVLNNCFDIQQKAYIHKIAGLIYASLDKYEQSYMMLKQAYKQFISLKNNEQLLDLHQKIMITISNKINQEQKKVNAEFQQQTTNRPLKSQQQQQLYEKQKQKILNARCDIIYRFKKCLSIFQKADCSNQNNLSQHFDRLGNLFAESKNKSANQFINKIMYTASLHFDDLQYEQAYINIKNGIDSYQFNQLQDPQKQITINKYNTFRNKYRQIFNKKIDTEINNKNYDKILQNLRRYSFDELKQLLSNDNRLVYVLKYQAQIYKIKKEYDKSIRVLQQAKAYTKDSKKIDIQKQIQEIIIIKAIDEQEQMEFNKKSIWQIQKQQQQSLILAINMQIQDLQAKLN